MKTSAWAGKADTRLAARVRAFPVAARRHWPMPDRNVDFDPVEFARAIREVDAAAGALRWRYGRLATLWAKWRPRLLVWIVIALLWSVIGVALAGLLSLYVALSG